MHFGLRSLVAALLTCLGLTGQAQSAVVQNVVMNFASGATFTGQVSFVDDFSSYFAVTGTLTGYQLGTPGYVGSGSTSINWVWNSFNYSSGANNYSNFLLDGTPSTYSGATSNWIQFAYNYGSALTIGLLFTSGVSNSGALGVPGPTDNFVNYEDPMLSGSITPTPLPGALLLFLTGLGALRLLSWCRRSPRSASA